MRETVTRIDEMDENSVKGEVARHLTIRLGRELLLASCCRGCDNPECPDRAEGIASILSEASGYEITGAELTKE